MRNNLHRSGKPALAALSPFTDENGLQYLVEYYQSLFEIEENINYYSREDFQMAKRKFVKHLINHRSF